MAHADGLLRLVDASSQDEIFLRGLLRTAGTVADLAKLQYKPSTLRRVLRVSISNIGLLTERSKRVKWGCNFLSMLCEEEARLSRLSQEFEEARRGRKIVFRNAAPYFVDKAGEREPALHGWINCHKAARFCTKYANLFARRIHADIFMELDIRERFQLAAYASAHMPGNTFATRILRDPEKIRDLIIASPERDSIAFGHLIPRNGPVQKLQT